LKVVIFCGGYATRFNKGRPGPLKPLIKINGIPILKRIISIYLKAGIKNFVLLGGYKINLLRKFTKNFKNINITVLDTGEGTPTGGRLLKAKKIIGNEDFFLTYGDSLTNFNPAKAIKFRKSKKNSFIVSYFKYFIPYGVLGILKNKKIKFIKEKNLTTNINAGFYIFDKRIFNFIKKNKDSFEKNVLPRVLKDKKTSLYGLKCTFWHPMDTHADRFNLEQVLKKNNL